MSLICGVICLCVCFVFFFKQKTAYEMRISDWSSDVCSSDLFWHWALGADGGHGHAQPPFRSSRLIGAERQPTSDCRQSLQQSHSVNDEMKIQEDEGRFIVNLGFRFGFYI